MDAKKRGTMRGPIAKRSPDAIVAKRGWLEKQGSDGLRLWKSRWFVLSEYCLYYYRDSREDKLLGSITLPSYTVSPLSGDERPHLRRHSFRLQHANMRTYYFCCPSRDAMADWVNAIALASIMQPQQHDSQLIDGDRTNESTTSVHRVSTAAPQQLASTLQSTPSGADRLGGSCNSASPHQPLYANAPPKPRRLGEAEPCSSPDFDTSTSLSAAMIYPSPTGASNSSTVTSEVNLHTPVRQAGRMFQENRTPEIHSPLSSHEHHQPAPSFHGKNQTGSAILNSDLVEVNDMSPAVRKSFLLDCSINSATTIPTARHHPTGDTVLDVNLVHSGGNNSSVQVAMTSVPIRPKSSLAIIEGSTSQINIPGEPFKEGVTEQTNVADQDWTEQEYANRMRQASYSGLVDPASSVMNTQRQLNRQCQQSSVACTTVMRGSRQRSSVVGLFSRSASARYGPRLTRDQLNSSRMQTPTFHHERQREESMQRLLEWKQRMLMSPLTRKSAKISCSRSVTPVGHFRSRRVSGDRERHADKWSRPQTVHGLPKPDFTGDVEADADLNNDYVNLLHMRSSEVDAPGHLNPSSQLPNRNVSLPSANHNHSTNQIRLSNSHCGSEHSILEAIKSNNIDRSYQLTGVSSSTYGAHGRVDCHYGGSQTETPSDGTACQADVQLDSLLSVNFEGSSISKHSDSGYDTLRADLGTQGKFSLEQRKVFQGVTDRDITNLVDSFEHGFAAIDSAEHGDHEQKEAARDITVEYLEPHLKPSVENHRNCANDHGEPFGDRLNSLSDYSESVMMQEPLKPIKSPTEVSKALVSTVSNGYKGGEFIPNTYEEQMMRVTSSAHEELFASVSDSSDIPTGREASHVREIRNGKPICSNWKSRVEKVKRRQQSLKFGDELKPKPHMGTDKMNFDSYTQESENANNSPEPLYANSVVKTRKHVSPENHYLPMISSNQITVKENDLGKDSKIKLHLSRAPSEPLPPLPSFEDGTYMEMCPNNLDLNFEGSRGVLNKLLKNDNIGKSHDYSIIPDNSCVFKGSVRKKQEMVSGSQSVSHGATHDGSKCGKTPAVPLTDSCHDSSSDADDESSKGPEKPRSRRFSLSDTFRPASYYLQTHEKHTGLDSSDSELVFPPFTPPSPQVINRAQSAIDYSRNVGGSLSYIPTETSNKQTNKYSESSDRLSQVSGYRLSNVSTGCDSLPHSASPNRSETNHFFVLKSEDRYPESDASSFSHKELRSEEKYPLSESVGHNQLSLSGELPMSFLASSKTYENITSTRGRKDSDVSTKIPACEATNGLAQEKRLSSGSLASIELLPVHTPEFLSEFARSVQERATPEVKRPATTIIDNTMVHSPIASNTLSQMTKGIETRMSVNQPRARFSRTNPVEDETVVTDVAEPIVCHHPRGNSNVSVGSVNSTGSENRAPYYYSDLMGSAIQHNKIVPMRPQLNNQKELEIYKPSNIGRKVNRISKRRPRHNDQISSKLRSSYEYIASHKRSEIDERNIFVSEAHRRVHQHVDNSVLTASYKSGSNNELTPIIIEGNSSICHRRIRSLDGVIDGSASNPSLQRVCSPTCLSKDNVYEYNRSQTPDLLNSTLRNDQSAYRLMHSGTPDSIHSQGELQSYRPEDRPPMPLPRSETFGDRPKAPPYRPPPPVVTHAILDCRNNHDFYTRLNSGAPNSSKSKVAHSSKAVRSRCHKIPSSRSMDQLGPAERYRLFNNCTPVTKVDSDSRDVQSFRGTIVIENGDRVSSHATEINPPVELYSGRHSGSYFSNGLTDRCISGQLLQRLPLPNDSNSEQLRQWDSEASAPTNSLKRGEKTPDSLAANRPPSAPQLRDLSVSSQCIADGRIDGQSSFAHSESISRPDLPNNATSTSTVSNKEPNTGVSTSESIANASNLASMFIHCVLSKG